MKIKSQIWQWLAVASGCVGLLYSLGVEGGIQTTGEVNSNNLTTAFVLMLLALLFLKLYFSASDREKQEARKAHRKLENTVKPARQNRRGA